MEPLYVEARRVLLDALEALAPHRDAVIVVGAQAIYIHAGDADFGVAPYTTDADLALDPTRLEDEPNISETLTSAGFVLSGDPGIWEAVVMLEAGPTTVPVDLLVPLEFAQPGGRRGARLGPHGHRAARKVSGLEACLIDNELMKVGSLNPDDRRSVVSKVAGRTALLIAKIHKIKDRVATGTAGRIDDKDAADAYRLMLVTSPNDFAVKVAELREHKQTRVSVIQAIDALPDFFGRSAGPGIQMAARALRVGVPEGRIIEVCIGFVKEAMKG